jgi:transposase
MPATKGWRPCLGPDLLGASVDGPPGADVSGAARAETFGAGGAGPWAVEAVDPQVGDRRSGAPKKQRHTARRSWQRLVDGYGAELGESTASSYVAQLRRELTGGVACVTVPQVHAAGEEAEVDFGELWVWLNGTLTKVWLFVLRLSASGKAFHMAFSSQAAEAFLEGHVLAFQALGGVPGRSATTVRITACRPGSGLTRATTDQVS